MIDRHQRTPAVSAAIGLVALTTALTACGGAAGSAGADAGPAQPGGTLNYGLSTAPTCSDPAQAGTNQTIYVTRAVVDSLTDQDPDTGEIVPWLAEKWETDADATSFTFTLKDGVSFSDGTPVTAQSVKNNFDAIVGTLGAAKAPLAASYLAGYVGTTVVDPRTAQVTFSSPNAQFLQASATSQLGLQADATTSLSAEERCQGGNIGSGPFTYTDYQQDRSVSVARRAGYSWGSPAFGHTGEAYLDGIEFTVVPESGVRTGSLSSGQLDAVSDALPQDAPTIEATGGRVLTTSNPGTPFGIAPNVSRGVLADPDVRRALVPAIDRQQLVDTVLGPNFLPATSTLASRTPGYVSLPDVTFDADAARTVLDRAGWVPAADGIREKDGQRLSFSILFSAVFAGNKAILELLQQQLRDVGVDARLELTSVPESIARQNAGDFDATYYNSTRGDGDILRTSFAADGRNLNQRGPIADLDASLTDQLRTTDTTQRGEYLANAQQQVLDNGLWIPTVELSQAVGASSAVQDQRFDASARLQFFDTWLSRS
ncbi:ABC transporter substrate-binding protein [Rhodococcus sp. SORGH_AS_0303]|uniref:ABC transporter substrate-binding protein n=1 Tax=Rhodococcus sp. SORGH_AS_0303 TaxID=3041753 RepID=UPI00277E7B6A|nr:ABC transporter substrate-binding protein [Rhodococcus sp. SORGH_AS_0303]MDQ1202497.1 peptide/nickel transport system substrate-binding protein [Rhodococcus sp. SORGH_AS_0303]